MVLRGIILRAISGDSVEEQKLIKICTEIAEAYLNMRLRKDAYLFSLISTPRKSLALDCIAELFEKKEGRLIVFQKYFDSTNSELQNESEFHTHLRRLVFSKVNETLYHYYKSFDPSLGKIIRNIKRVFSEEEVDSLGYNRQSGFIYLKNKNTGELLMPIDLIERNLSPVFKSSLSTKDILLKLSAVFKTHDYYAGKVKINVCAEIIRRLHQFYSDDTEHFNFSDHEDIRNKDLKRLINKSVKKVQIDLHGSYVAKNKISDEDFAKYFLVAEKVLTGDYVKCNDNGKSYFEHFCEVVKNATKKEYRESHRKYIEYFVKISRLSFIQTLKREE